MKTLLRIVAISSVITCSATEAAASDAARLITMEAKKQGVPVTFALKMADIESGTRCGVNNRSSSASGPLQILVPTARAMGYKGNIRHASCGVQVHYGMKHLAMCYNGARGNLALARRCHQQGVSVLGRKHVLHRRSHKGFVGRQVRNR